MARMSGIASAPVGRGGGRGAAGPSRVDLQSDAEIIQGQIETLRAWAYANDNDAKNDRRRYWLLKIPAIIFAASTSALEAASFHSAVIVLGILSAVCVAIDAALPGGLLHNSHRKAANEIFLLADSLKTDWDNLTIQFRDASAAQSEAKRAERLMEILMQVQNEKRRINDELTAAEASLDKKPKTTH